MPGLWRLSRALACAICGAGLSFCMASNLAAQDTTHVAPAVPQEVPPTATAPRTSKLVFPVLVFDRARVLDQSEIGKDLDARIDAARAELLAENDKIYADLEAEEQQISDLKPTLSEADFRARAQAFDDKVTAARASQDEKARAIQTLYDEGLTEVESDMNTVLAQIAREFGAVLVFERGQVYLMSGAIDISEIVIEKLDEQSGEEADMSETAPAPSETSEK